MEKFLKCLKKYEPLLRCITDFIIVITLIVTILQLKQADRANIIQSFSSITEQEKNIRPDFALYHVPLEKLTKQLQIEVGDPQEFYYKDEYASIRRIGQHYEQIGLLVKEGIVPFDLVYQAIPFPDDFWNKSSQLRKTLRTKWISDFWVNFEDLHVRYMVKRKTQ